MSWGQKLIFSLSFPVPLHFCHVASSFNRLDWFHDTWATIFCYRNWMAYFMRFEPKDVQIAVLPSLAWLILQKYWEFNYLPVICSSLIEINEWFKGYISEKIFQARFFSTGEQTDNGHKNFTWSCGSRDFPMSRNGFATSNCTKALFLKVIKTNGESVYVLHLEDLGFSAYLLLYLCPLCQLFSCIVCISVSHWVFDTLISETVN